MSGHVQGRDGSPPSRLTNERELPRIRCLPIGADACDLACREARVRLAWRDGAWWVQTDGWTRRLRSEHGAPASGFYDPGDGLPPHGGAFEGHDAPRRPELISEREYRARSRPAARKAAERLVRALAVDERALERELGLHPGWERAA